MYNITEYQSITDGKDGKMKKIEPQKIKSLRIRQGLSQQKLARLLGISDRAISKWELGYSQPSADHLVALAQIFGANMEDFLSDVDTVKKEEAKGFRVWDPEMKTKYNWNIVWGIPGVFCLFWAIVFALLGKEPKAAEEEAAASDAA